MNMPKKYYFVVLPFLTLLYGCAATPNQLLYSATVFAACPAAAKTDAPATPPALPAATCAEQASLYSDAVWVPFFGPLYEAAVNPNPDSEPGLTVLSSLLPVIGPALQTGLGAKRCLAQCLPPATALTQTDDAHIKAYFNQALDVSDDNCRHFLQQWRGGESASAETIGGPAQGRLEAVLADTIRENRRQARQILQQLQPTVADVQSRIGAYDGLCSVEHALTTLEDATRNQLSGSFISDMAEQKNWLTKSGIAAPDDGKPKDPIRHINNILRPGAPGAARPLAEKKKAKKH
jgi:hypothetical protein